MSKYINIICLAHALLGSMQRRIDWKIGAATIGSLRNEILAHIPQAAEYVIRSLNNSIHTLYNIEWARACAFFFRYVYIFSSRLRSPIRQKPENILFTLARRTRTFAIRPYFTRCGCFLLIWARQKNRKKCKRPRAENQKRKTAILRKRNVRKIEDFLCASRLGSALRFSRWHWLYCILAKLSHNVSSQIYAAKIRG